MSRVPCATSSVNPSAVRLFDRFEPERFEYEVERAESREPFGVRAVAYSGDDYDGRAGASLSQMPEQFEAAQTGH